jgi:uncharacterized Zn finger protein
MMAKRKRGQADSFADLTWDDLEQWVGGKILARGQRYQGQGRVSELAATSDGGLVAWVSGTEEYATKVVMEEEGRPDSVCTCPYAINCKHGVAVVLKDPLEICSDFEKYLDRRHPKEVWSTLADQLLAQLKTFTPSRGEDEFSRNYARDRLSDWAIHALQHAGRSGEIIPLCEAEAPRTGSYERLVAKLIHKHRYEDAERWIREGVQATEKKLPGIAQSLRNWLKTIRASQKDTPALAVLEVEEFVRSPSHKAFADCEKASRNLNVWPSVRAHLLTYLESGVLPWKQEGWPLPPPGLEVPQLSPRATFPLIGELIDIAICEKDPERILYWYDRRSKSRFGWVWVNEDRIAEAIETYAPDRAVAMWKSKAESLIARVSPSAYEEAARYLRKTEAVLVREGNQQEWTRYLQELRDTHARKRRLIEVLDRLTRKPILAKKTKS